jgi:hypothetical protein
VNWSIDKVGAFVSQSPLQSASSWGSTFNTAWVGDISSLNPSRTLSWGGAVLVLSGWYNKMPRAGWPMNHRHLFPAVLVAEGLKSGHGWAQVRTS